MEKKDKAQKTRLNLYQKLLEIRRGVEYIKKEAKGFKYFYTKESQIIGAIRPKMDELGVFLEVEMLKPECQDKNITVGFEFTWIDCDNPTDRITKHVYLSDVAGDPKRVGGLLTYATRYHLLKTFQIATDDMDIDTFQDQTMGAPTITKPRISRDQVNELELKINGNEDLRAKILANIPGGTLENLTVDRFSAALAWVERVQGDDHE